MTRTQALRKAVKLFGKNATITDYRRKSSHEARSEAKAKLKALRESCNTPELQKLHRKELDELRSQSMYYRFSVGEVVMGMFNSIKAMGDSWEGCFRAWEKNPSATAHEMPEQEIAA